MQFSRYECVKLEKFTSGLFSHLLILLIASPRTSDLALTELYIKFVSKHDDLFLYTLRNLKSMLAKPMTDLLNFAREHVPSVEKKEGDATAIVNGNFLRMLLLFTSVPDAQKLWLPREGLDEATVKELTATTGAKNSKKALSECWVKFLARRFDPALYKEVLALAETAILPRLSSPLLLADFFTDSYNVGGVVGLLALNGLFVLMAKHNLDYPKFYPKLFAYCTPSVFHAKHRARFFKLLHTFLSSSLLPSYLVAAFAKRLSRLALSAPPDGCNFVCALVYNLLRSHTAVQTLLHRPGAADAFNPVAAFLNRTNSSDGQVPSLVGLLGDASQHASRCGTALVLEAQPSAAVSRGFDPFVETEDDPNLCRASESSLWELKTLESHYCPHVARMARVFFSSNAPKTNYAIQEFTQGTYASLFETEIGWRKNQKMPLEFEPSSTLFDDQDIFARCFSLV
jgi:U3 small nucleolar RNA-associated protein 19